MYYVVVKKTIPDLSKSSYGQPVFVSEDKSLAQQFHRSHSLAYLMNYSNWSLEEHTALANLLGDVGVWIAALQFFILHQYSLETILDQTELVFDECPTLFYYIQPLDNFGAVYSPSYRTHQFEFRCLEK